MNWYVIGIILFFVLATIASCIYVVLGYENELKEADEIMLQLIENNCDLRKDNIEQEKDIVFRQEKIDELQQINTTFYDILKLHGLLQEVE